MDKEALRHKFLALRKAIPEHRTLISAIVLRRSLERRGKILSFYPIGSEIDLSLLNLSLKERGCFHLPRLEENLLTPYLCTEKMRLLLSSLKVPEPDPETATKAEMKEIDLILVPALAFDAEGYRLGYGQGHYDRLLATFPNTPTLGVGFKEQLSSEPLPRDSWDVPVQKWLLV